MKVYKKFIEGDILKTKIYHSNGNIKSIEYKLYNERHNENGPAFQSWFENGQKSEEIYYIKGKKHREDGPAYQYWYENGQIRETVYYINDRIHREDGIATTIYSRNGKLIRISYGYNNHEFFNKKGWLDTLKLNNSPYYQEQKKLYDMEQDIEKYNL